MRGRYLLGLSTANRQAARFGAGEVDVELDTSPVSRPSLRTSPAPWTPIRPLAPPIPKPQAAARARHRPREESRDAQTTDRDGLGNAADGKHPP